MRARLAVAVATAGVLAADLATKAAVRANLAPYESVPVIPGVLWVTHVRNEGAAFGMLQGGRWLFVAIAVGVIVGVTWYLSTRSVSSPWMVGALALVAGGSLGNVYDRVLAGKVTDFVDLGWFPVFNVADSAVVVGTGILVVWTLFSREPEGGDGEDAGVGAVSS